MSRNWLRLRQPQHKWQQYGTSRNLQTLFRNYGQNLKKKSTFANEQHLGLVNMCHVGKKKRSKQKLYENRNNVNIITKKWKNPWELKEKSTIQAKQKLYVSSEGENRTSKLFNDLEYFFFFETWLQMFLICFLNMITRFLKQWYVRITHSLTHSLNQSIKKIVEPGQGPVWCS